MIFLIDDEEGEKFGYYLNTEVVEKYWQRPGDPPVETDKKSFEFNLESNGRLPKPMKFEIKDVEIGGYTLFKKFYDLISLGEIYLRKENKKNESCCYQHEDEFDYHGIKKALCGKTYYYPDYENFTTKRIIVIQMK